MKLARVGDPFIDQDQAGAVFLEQFAQRIAGAGGLVVVGRDARIGGPAPQLPGQFAPQRAHHRAVALAHRIAGRDLVADQHDAARGGQLCDLGLLQDAVDAREFQRIDAGEQVVQGQHRVGFAAAEVGLKLHHRIAALVAEAAGRPDQQPLQTFGEVGAPEKLHRVAVLVRALAEVNLPQIGGELGLLVAAAGHIPMRRDDLPPRFQRRRRGALDRAPGLPAPRAARLLVEAHAQQFHLEAFEVLRLGGRHRGQEPGGGIQRPIGIVAGKALLMRPAIAVAAQLADQAALRRAENRAKHLVPGLPHQPQQSGDIPLRDRLVRQPRIFGVAAQPVRIEAARLDRALDLALDKGAEARFQQFQRLADPFVVSGHLLSLPSCPASSNRCAMFCGDGSWLFSALGPGVSERANSRSPCASPSSGNRGNDPHGPLRRKLAVSSANKPGRDYQY